STRKFACCRQIADRPLLLAEEQSCSGNRWHDRLSRLGRAPALRGGRSSLKGRKVPVKYRDKSGNTWAGRGAQPRWLREKLKAGAKLEDFAVHKTAASRKAAFKKRRRAKR